MANDTQITVVGNLTADPQLRFTQSGTPVANFTVASTPRVFDRQANQWRDGETLFLQCSVWRDYAENVAESLKKGMAVIVHGKLEQRSYEKDGQQRSSYQVAVDEVGPTLRYARAQVVKAAQNASQPPTQADPYQGGQQAAWDAPGNAGAPF